MSEDLLTEEYPDEASAAAGKRKRWAEGWLVRRRQKVEVRAEELPLDVPATDSGHPGVFVAFLGIAIVLGIFAVRRSRPREVIQVTYERANEE